LLGARSTDLRSHLRVLEAISGELARLGSHREAARVLHEARRRMDAAMALLRGLASPWGARCRPDPQARLLGLCAAALRRAGDTGSAGYALDRLSRLQPGAAAPGYILLGEPDDALRDLQAARPHLQAGLHTPLKREELVLNLELQSHLFRRLGRPEEAQAAAREALHLYRAPERPPIQDEWYQRWLHRLTRSAGEHRRLRLEQAAGTEAGVSLENLAAGLGRAALEVHVMEAGVAAELAGHIFHRAGRMEAAFHSFHRALETYSHKGEEWETGEHPYEDDFLTLEQLAREEFALLVADLGHPRSGLGMEPTSERDWKEPPRRVEILMRTLYTPEEFRRWGEHDVEDYFAGFHPGPLDRDPEEVLAEFQPPG
ncbi:MAG: hypothetical protein HY558_03075, partial [Euryarchaeota archaeon]|nr:hypothetical protein [Euryarchaeota archaeon]